ncbi:MAG: enoyl-CoA hydratase/isomerase family protein [Myxococcales bacterium]|nr:enoyl-CoA hydratase/isomerase family protein [Myxococcales bacterium]
MPVHYDIEGRIGHIQLEGRGDYNVFSPEYVYNPLHDALTAYRQDPEVWVVIISAVAGRKAFTYGGDIQSLDALASGDDGPTRGYEGGNERIWRPNIDPRTEQLFNDELKLNKPVVFALEGDCLGAGTLLLMSLADIAVAAKGARFGLPEIKPAIGPITSWAEALATRQLPWRIAMELLLTGRLMPAEEALGHGFLNRVVDASEVLDVAREYAEQIAANPPLHVQASKTLAKSCREMPFAAGMLQGDLMGEVLRSVPDSQEGPRAFMEKRKPRYTGKIR